MKVVYGIGHLAKAYPKSVAAIGVFDAVHRGHQRVIGRAVAEARRLGGKSLVVTFHPHPVSVLHPERFSAYVLSLEHRLRLIGECGVDVCIVIPFTKRFAMMKPGDFVNDVLVKKLGVQKIVVGEDFCFGRDRQGTFGSLDSGPCFLAEKVPILKLKNINIKTKKIKNLVAAGDLKVLKSFLGREYSIFAEVESGDARGRRLGFPTANLRQENVITLPSGIYCVRALFDGKERSGVCYIGTRPTFEPLTMRRVLELHVFDYRGNLYGKKIFVKFFKKIRDDRRFSDEKDLILQIRRDIVAVRKFLDRKFPQ